MDQSADQIIAELQRRIAELERSVSEGEIVKQSLLQSNGHFRAIIKASPLAIQTLTADGIVTMWNDAAERMFGWSNGETIGRLNPLVPEDKLEEFRRLRERVLSGESFSGVEVRRRRKDGSTIDISLSTAPLRNPEGAINGILAIISDVTERRQLEEKLRILSVTDELTGLHNRRGFFSLVEQMIKVAMRQKDKICILYADLDNLKGINDTWGHQEGDRALIDAANILRGTYRESDVVARLGGDEFAVVPVGSFSDDMETISTRLEEAVADFNSEETRNYRLSISIGFSIFDPELPCSIDELLARADELMYEQKRLNCERRKRVDPSAER